MAGFLSSGSGLLDAVDSMSGAEETDSTETDTSSGRKNQAVRFADTFVHYGSKQSQAAQSRCTVVRPMLKSMGKSKIRPPVKS